MTDGRGVDTDGSDGRRAALLLAALRLSRDPEMLPRLEAALAALDDGRRPPAARRAERRLLRGLPERMLETLEAEDERAWEAERDAEGGAGAAEMARMRLGLAPREGTPPEEAAAMRAAGELQARVDAGGAAGPGAGTKEGWVVAARLELEGGLSLLPADLWALLPPGGGALAFAASGALAPEVWSRAAVLEELEARRGDLALAEAFVRAADAADPAARAGRDAARAGFREWGAARRKGERCGAGELRLLDGRPVRADGAVVLGPGGGELAAGVEARRVDPPPPPAGPPADGAPPPPADRPWAEQVWARRLPSGEWRRGRLRPEPGRIGFVDEPAARTPGLGGGAATGGPPGGLEGRDLGRDLPASGTVRRKAAESAVYARLLYAALEGGAWRHRDGAVWAGGRRSAADLVAAVAGGGDHLDWAWGGPAGVLDEEVAADLRALGWEREGADG